jgi:hypothetical protein
MDVGHDESPGIHNRAVDMRLSGKVDNDVTLGYEPIDECDVRDTSLHKAMLWIPLGTLQILQVPSIGQVIERHHLVLRILSEDKVNKITADKSSSSCDQ